MHQCCCDSQHAAVAPGAIRLSQPLSHSTGRGEHRRISTLGKKIRASDSNLPCIILSLRSSRALRCTYTNIIPIVAEKAATSVWLQVAKRWRGNSVMWREKKCCRGKVPSMPYLVFLHPQSFPQQKLFKFKKWKTYCRGPGSGIPVGCIRAYH